MAAPVFIAVNQTGADILLVQLACNVPASGNINLSYFNIPSAIKDDDQLKFEIESDNILIYDGITTLTKSESLQYVSYVVSINDLENVESNADVTRWSNVSAALGGRAGVNANRVFKSDGSGSGEMVVNKLNIAHRLVVGVSGDVDFLTIEGAVSAAIAGGASAVTPWEIVVMPGTYVVANPVTIPSGILITQEPAQRINAAFLVALDPNADLFVFTGSSFVTGVQVSGVLDPLHYCFRCLVAGTFNTFYGVACKHSSNGWLVSGGASLVLNQCACNITGANQSVGTLVTATGANTWLRTESCVVLVPPAVLPLYVANPIQTAFRIADGADAYLGSGLYHLSDKDGLSDVVLADGGSRVVLSGGEAIACSRVLHIGASGASTVVCAQSCNMKDNQYNVYNESTTGTVFSNFMSDSRKVYAAAGSPELGIIQYHDDKSMKLFGNVKYNYVASNKDVDFADYFADNISSGVCGDGIVTAGVGLFVDVTAGDGWVARPEPDDDAFWVEWEATLNVPLIPSETNYVYVDSATAIVTVGVSPVSSSNILLATIITDGTGIRFLHNTRTVIDNPMGRINQYLIDTQHIRLKSGLAVTQGTGSTHLVVDSGSYYAALNIISYTSPGGNAVWSYFYGTAGVTEVPTQSEVDVTNYDLAGTLTEMTAGNYRVDTVYLTSDGRISVIYGTEQYAIPADADVALLSPKPPFIDATAISLARVVVQKTTGITHVYDARPMGSGSTGTGTSGVTSHHALSDLSLDDHTQYYLVTGARSMSGNLNMGTNSITNVNTVNGVDISAHASRHNTGGSDALSTGTPVAVQVDATPSAGDGSSFAINNHQHGIVGGGDVDTHSVGTSNTGGSSSKVAHADHAHKHDTQTDPTNHAAATTLANGFMTSSQVTQLAATAADNAVVHLTGNETVAGIKTFSSSPLIPTPTTTTQAANLGTVRSNNKFPFRASALATDTITETDGVVIFNGSVGPNASWSIVRASLSLNQQVILVNDGSLILTINRTASDNFHTASGSATSFVLLSGQSVRLESDGTSVWYVERFSSFSTVSSLSVGGSSSSGSSLHAAASDHIHGLPAFGTSSGTFSQGNDSRFYKIQMIGSNIVTTVKDRVLVAQEVGNPLQWFFGLPYDVGVTDLLIINPTQRFLELDSRNANGLSINGVLSGSWSQLPGTTSYWRTLGSLSALGGYWERIWHSNPTVTSSERSSLVSAGAVYDGLVVFDTTVRISCCWNSASSVWVEL